MTTSRQIEEGHPSLLLQSNEDKSLAMPKSGSLDATIVPTQQAREQAAPTTPPRADCAATPQTAKKAPAMAPAAKPAPSSATKDAVWRYRRQKLQERADLLAYAMTKVGGYVFLWILLAEMRLIRWLVEPSQSFFAVCKVGLFVKDPLGRKERNESQLIRLENVEKGTGLRVKHGSLETIAPKIATIRDALYLRARGADLVVPQLSWDPDPARRFTIMDRTGTFAIVPMIVKVEQTRSTEPIIHLHIYAQYGNSECPDWSFLGKALTSGHDAVCHAMYGHLYAKIAMPNGGAIPVELSALGTAASPQGPFEASLSPRLRGVPNLAQIWLRRFPSIFDLPLSEEVRDLRADWSSSFPVEEDVEE